jgi:hypothetical protein
MRKLVVGLSLNAASTSCRPPCGVLILADCVWDDGAGAGQMSMGCQCQTGPLLLLDHLAVHRLAIRPRSQPFGPSSCSVPDDQGRPIARNGA